MEVTNEVGVLQLAILYIKNNNLQGLSRILYIMPLEKVDQPEVLLNMFLSVAAGYNRANSVNIILDSFKVVYPEQDKIQIKSRLFLIPIINISTLSFVILSDPSYTFVEALDDFIEWDSSPAVTSACEKADRIFGEQLFTTYDIIREHAFEQDNARVEAYAIAKMQETSPYADIPDWVKNYREGEPLPTEEQLDKYALENYTGKAQFEIPPDDEAVELLTAGLSHMGISIGEIDDVKEYLRLQLSTSTRMEKIAMLSPVMENQANLMLTGEADLFRIYGPANPLVGQDLTLPGKSNMYGGCRMILCDIFDYNEEFDFVEDWFTGACQQCHFRIRHPWHAIRRPRPHGGWEGIFCSFKCLRTYIIPDEPDLITNQLINDFEKDFNSVGIQERVPRDSKK